MKEAKHSSYDQDNSSYLASYLDGNIATHSTAPLQSEEIVVTDSLAVIEFDITDFNTLYYLAGIQL